MTDYIRNVTAYFDSTYDNNPYEFEGGMSDEIYNTMKDFAYKCLLTEENEYGEISQSVLESIEQFIAADGSFHGTIIEEALRQWEEHAYSRQ
jgi:hypothetical protein